VPEDKPSLCVLQGRVNWPSRMLCRPVMDDQPPFAPSIAQQPPQEAREGLLAQLRAEVMVGPTSQGRDRPMHVHLRLIVPGGISGTSSAKHHGAGRLGCRRTVASCTRRRSHSSGHPVSRASRPARKAACSADLACRWGGRSRRKRKPRPGALAARALGPTPHRSGWR
jgi:hypothetical protein